MKKYLPVILYTLLVCQYSYATQIDELSKTVIFLRKQTQKTIPIEGKSVGLYYRDPNTKEFMPLLESNIGTGFIISYQKKDYIVTAKHVAEMLTPTGEIIFNLPNGKTFNVSFQTLSGVEIIRGARWFHHQKVDLSIHPMAYPSKDTGILSIPEELFRKTMDVNVNLLGTAYILGFPMGLGALDNLSPVAKEAKVASKLTSISNLNIPKDVYFYLLDQALSQGYNGSPVFYSEDIMSDAITMDNRPLLKTGEKIHLLGVQSLAISDQTGGKISAVVPISYLWDIFESEEFEKYIDNLEAKR